MLKINILIKNNNVYVLANNIILVLCARQLQYPSPEFVIICTVNCNLYYYK